jgi:cyclic beta-1,2-glucan synthetase
MYRVILESLLGFSVREGREIVLRPRLPAEWPGARIAYRPGPDAMEAEATEYDIELARGTEERREPGSARGLATTEWVLEASLDGSPLTAEDGVVIVPLTRDGGVHRVRVILGRTAPGDRSATGPPVAGETGRAARDGGKRR